MSRLITLFLLTAFAALPGRAADDLPPPEKTGGIDLRSPEAVARGVELLNTTCGGYCHGTNGVGIRAPRLRNRTDLSPTSLYATISFGRKRGGKMMPGWRGTLSEEDIWSAVAAVVSLREAPIDPDAPNATTAH